MDDIIIDIETSAFEKPLIRVGAPSTSLTGSRSASLPPLPTSPHSELDCRSGGAGRRLGRYLPPPPPLTPPSLAASYPLEEVQFDHDAFRVGKLDSSSDVSFIHQPNPDYTAELEGLDATTSALIPLPPRRRNYTKLVVVGISAAPASAVPSQNQPMLVEREHDDLADVYASTLHQPPAKSRQRSTPASPNEDMGREIGLQGEIISTLDDQGAGWKRHTRVYGGGVCLACLAAEGGSRYFAGTGAPKDLQ
ncbi:hypothetical protein CMQ_5468 [Grosmannia clavigera kw1407]|uniref:Uncharacterized protein n=1 Tax=Grosmannia clavigera (strain kw1407 / UAMH 11150) TaxID=655863 RepID=F0XRN2_GROCL|nr:uncharacterized protein CMQ_5468 [Grosmannia clavigera kw1407]EFW99657.1 hypothetical protein CMQ_5468 [Grosmannia clavigera kw1407]